MPQTIKARRTKTTRPTGTLMSVPDMLREIAYVLHTTRRIGHVPHAALAEPSTTRRVRSASRSVVTSA